MFHRITKYLFTVVLALVFLFPASALADEPVVQEHGVDGTRRVVDKDDVPFLGKTPDGLLIEPGDIDLVEQPPHYRTEEEAEFPVKEIGVISHSGIHNPRDYRTRVHTWEDDSSYGRSTFL